MEQFLLYFVIALISLVFAVVTVYLGKRHKNKTLPKYIPAMAAGAAAIGFIVKTAWFSEGFEGLGYAILFVISAVIFLVAIVTAIILEIINRRNNPGRDSQP